MKSNYMKSAEIKIAKNPEMGYWDKYILKQAATLKEIKLKEQLGLVNRLYIPADAYPVSRGFRAQNMMIDEYAMPTLTREHLERLIDNVQATTAQEPIFIGTRDGLDAVRYYYMPYEITLPDAVADIRWGE